MKVILVMDSISRAGGGLLDAERCLHQEMEKLGVNPSVMALQDSFSDADLPGWAPLVPKVFPHIGPGALGASPSLHRALTTESADLIYRAGLWRLPSKYSHEWSKKHRRPEIIAPHGMLDPWAVRNSRWKKRLAHVWFEGAHLRDAACIRALCQSEADSIRAYGLKNQVCIIPNGIDLPNTDNRQPTTDNGPKVLLFLGRLHPKKGLPNALRAWKQALHSTSKIASGYAHQGVAEFQRRECSHRVQNSKFDEWQFVIAGWDQNGHEAELKQLCKELGLAYADVPAASFLAENCKLNTENSQILFVGPAFGVTKDQLLRSASAFILPSFSEGLPMSVLEAWSYRLPVLMTDHCNLPEGFAADAAIRIGTDAESIAEGLREFFSLPTTDNGQPTTSLSSLGRNGRALVERQFTWPQVAAQMKEVYEWVLGAGPRPCCVV